MEFQSSIRQGCDKKSRSGDSRLKRCAGKTTSLRFAWVRESTIAKLLSLPWKLGEILIIRYTSVSLSVRGLDPITSTERYPLSGQCGTNDYGEVSIIGPFYWANIIIVIGPFCLNNEKGPIILLNITYLLFIVLALELIKNKILCHLKVSRRSIVKPLCISWPKPLANKLY